DCIVRLPDKLFLTTGIPACIFILSKNRNGKDGVHRERTSEILFIDTSKMGAMESRKLRVFTDDDIEKVTNMYHNWRNVPSSAVERSIEYANIDGFCYSATLEEVQKQDYKLTPGIYVGSEAIEDDGIPFEEKMEGLKTLLEKQFLKGNELQGRILENFEKF